MKGQSIAEKDAAMNATWQNIYIAIVLVSAAISGTLAVITLRFHRRNLLTRFFAPMMLAVAEWLITSYFVCLSKGDHNTLLWIYARYTGLALMVPCFAAFVFQLTGQTRWLTRKNLRLLFVIPVFTILVSWSNDLHGLMITDIHYSMDQSLLYVDSVTYGAYFWIHTAYCYAFMLVGIALLARKALHSFSLYRRQATIILLGVIPIVVVSVIDAFLLFPEFKHALSPIGFAISGIAFFDTIYHHRLMNVAPIARDLLIECLSDGVLVLDQNNTLVDINPAAEKILHLKAERIIGCAGEEVLSPWKEFFPLLQGRADVRTEINLNVEGQEKIFDLRINHAVDQNAGIIGHLIIIHEITHRKHMEAQLKQKNALLQEQLDEIHALHSRLQEQAARDPLTGLYNRRNLGETLKTDKELADQEHYPLSILMIDIDRFKSINDHYGHQCGDQALVWLSEQFGKTIRANDYIYRIGGEEFLILLRNANPQTACQRAESIRNVVETSDFCYYGQPIDLSVSIGVATYPYHGEEIDSVIRAADKALYAAKANGRNRVQVCGGTLKE